MYTILSSEILGYNTVQYFSLGTWASLHYLSGCVDGAPRPRHRAWATLFEVKKLIGHICIHM